MTAFRIIYKCVAIILTGMILTQCGDKSSSEYVQEGNDYSTRGLYNDAKESYLKSIEKDSKNIEGHYGLGGMYNLERKYEDAEKEFHSVIQLDPTHINGWYSLGYTYELMGKKEDSEKSYRKYRQLKERMDFIINKGKP